MNDSTLSTCIPGDNVMDRSLNSNKVSINADKTNYMHAVYSCNEKVNLSITKIGNNKMNETSVTKFLAYKN